MISAFTVLLIYSGEESKEMAENMRKAIEQSNYPVMVDLIDSDYRDRSFSEDISERIFKILDRCDFAIAFLTPAMAICDTSSKNSKEKMLYSSGPNLWLEVGYMRKAIPPQFIQYVSSFPFEWISTGKYLLPSDLPNSHIIYHDDQHSMKKIWQDLSDTLCREKIFSRLLVESNGDLLFSSNYKTDYALLFSANDLNRYNKIHEEAQYDILWKDWTDGNKAFATYSGSEKRVIVQWHLLYLYERIVFLAMFPQRFLVDINSLKYTYENEVQPELVPFIEIYNNILDYIARGNVHSEFYNRLYNRILSSYQLIEDAAPIVHIMAQNYLGLCSLNSVRADKETQPLKEKKERLDAAEKYFKFVINMSGISYQKPAALGDSLDIFKAFAYYNIARVYEEKEELEKAINAYNMAVDFRKKLAQNRGELPASFQVYFLTEQFHAELDFLQLCYDHPELGYTVSKEELRIIQDSIDEKSKTIQFTVPLFTNVKRKLEKLRNEMGLEDDEN